MTLSPSAPHWLDRAALFLSEAAFLVAGASFAAVSGSDRPLQVVFRLAAAGIIGITVLQWACATYRSALTHRARPRPAGAQSAGVSDVR
jgi:hypothetical protein